MSKLLLTDLDGTLLKDNKTISEVNRKAIDAMIEAGHYFVICTGRPVASGRKIAEDLGLIRKGCYIICFNGGVIYDLGQDLAVQKYTLPKPVVERLFAEAANAHVYIQTYDDSSILATEHTKELDYYRFHSNMPYRILSSIEDLAEEPAKALLIDLDVTGSLDAFQKQNLEWTEEYTNSFFSAAEYLEYVPKGIDKGAALMRLAEYLGVSAEDTYAIGDERNDISMLLAAGTGIAMQNARDEVKAIADAITEADNNHHGVAEAIRKFILEK